jgi:hypothetical protein
MIIFYIIVHNINLNSSMSTIPSPLKRSADEGGPLYLQHWFNTLKSLVDWISDSIINWWPVWEASKMGERKQSSTDRKYDWIGRTHPSSVSFIMQRYSVIRSHLDPRAKVVEWKEFESAIEKIRQDETKIWPTVRRIQLDYSQSVMKPIQRLKQVLILDLKTTWHMRLIF